MEELKLVDLQTQDPVLLSPSDSDFLLFFSLTDILLLKEISKDILATPLKGTAVYIGPEPKKVHLWRTKEPNSIPIFHGGAEIPRNLSNSISDLPSFIVFKSNRIFASGLVSSFSKPFIRSLLQRYPDLKRAIIQPVPVERSESEILETQEKIYNIEQVTAKNTADIEEIKRSIEEKDRMIFEILAKM
jgi:hypothetical protein